MLRALLLLLFITTSKGVTLEKVCVKSGEIVALECSGPNKSQEIWTTPQTSDRGAMNWTADGTLVLLSASDTQQGNYTCTQGKKKTYYELIVYTTLSSDCENFTLFSLTCHIGDSCTLKCPTAFIPKVNRKGVTWSKDDKVYEGKEIYFTKVQESHRGAYSCFWSFEYNRHIYNRTFTVKLYVEPKENIKNTGIISPSPNAVFHVDVGSSLNINCTVEAQSFSQLFDEVYWIMNKSSVKKNSGLRVHTKMRIKENETITVPLIFKEVSDEDLSTVFTCKLESVSQGAIAVNITLARKARPSYVAVAVVTVVIPVVLVVSVLISIKYKIHITLFLRDTLRLRNTVSDGKRFDACIMYYTGEQGAGLSEEDKRILQNMLEDHFGYNLCLFDRDVLPGRAVADAVLECVEQSRALLMVPASPDLNSESALLSAVHEALVERQTRLVFIQNKATEKAGAHPVLPETLQLLADLGHGVTWKGSFDQSSFFWKQLRYYLPPVQQHHKITLLPQTV
uniref:Interleukin-18 receptor 1 n=1 Tax=Neogobius melanostomus TaxID=47308 RepID=A0A8C6T6T1_9GOBI